MSEESATPVRGGVFMARYRKRCSKGHEWIEEPFKSQDVNFHYGDVHVGPLCFICLVELCKQNLGSVEIVETLPAFPNPPSE